MAPIIWLVVALALVGAEVLSGDLFLLMLGGGALAASATSFALDAPVWVDGAVFLVVSVLLVALLRQLLRRQLPARTGIEVGVAALEGRTAVVLEPISRHDGRVRLDGDVWSARPLNDVDTYLAGEHVTVMRIDGATAVVWKNT